MGLSGQGAVPRGRDLSLAISSFLARRPDGHGPFGRGTVSLPGLAYRGILQPLALGPQTARADRQISVEKIGRALAAKGNLGPLQAPLPGPDSPEFFQPGSLRLCPGAAFRRGVETLRAVQVRASG